MKQTKTTALGHVLATTRWIATFVASGACAFLLGYATTQDVSQIKTSDAQVPSTTRVSVILQYVPVGGGAPLPLEVTPFMNASQTALVHLQEIHSGLVVPPSSADRCRTTNALGRCSVRNVPVGGDPAHQYDIVVDTIFLEFLTRIPLVHDGTASVRFDESLCSDDTTSFAADTWCITQPNGTFASEYFVTITLQERDVCTNVTPPAGFCDVSGGIVTFRCNQSYQGATAPFEPVVTPCPSVQCPDGNYAAGQCDEVVPDVPACSTAAACVHNQLCRVQHVASLLPYTAGEDVIVVRGEHFDVEGGTVTFPVMGGGTETVDVYPGPDWTDTEIRVPIPDAAVTGALEIHPHSHGSTTDQDSNHIPVTCSTPTITIRGFSEQFRVEIVNATTPDGIQLVSPGYDTTLSLFLQHNTSVSEIANVEVQLLQGAYPDPDDLPIQRTIIAQSSCALSVVGSSAAREASVPCVVAVPENVASFPGPYTFVVLAYDSTGFFEVATIVDAGTSALLGDFTLDGRVSLMDAVRARRIADGEEEFTADQLDRDPNNDSTITSQDALYILHLLTGS